MPSSSSFLFLFSDSCGQTWLCGLMISVPSIHQNYKSFSESTICEFFRSVTESNNSDLHNPSIILTPFSPFYHLVLRLVDVPACLEYLLDSGIPHEAIHVCPEAQHGKCLFFDSFGMSLVRKAVGLPEPQPKSQK